MRALKFAASALLMAAAAFGQQATPYINPWANAGGAGQGAVGGSGITSAPVFGSGGNILSGNQVTFTTQQAPAYAGGTSGTTASAPSTSALNPGFVSPPKNDPYNGNGNPQYGNQQNGNPQYGGGGGNQYGNNPYGGSKPYQPLVDVSPYFSGDCSYSPCLNGGSCYDSSLYAKLSGNTVAAPGQFDTANAGDAESQLSAALAGRPVPNLYSKPANQYQQMSWCKCYGSYYGKYCENRQCDPKQNCSSDPMDQLLVVYPKNVQIECGSYMGATAAGAGAAIAADSCRQAVFTTSDRYESGPQNCPESMMVRRTWSGTDRCGKSSQGLQSIAVVDTKPPKVRAKLVPFPPLAVSASQITLTPEQVKAVVKVLLAVAIEGKKQLLVADPKLALLGGAGLFLFDGLNLNLNDVNSFLGTLVGKDLTRMNMTDIFGADTASLLLANGFDQSSIMRMLTADPTLSGANSILNFGSTGSMGSMGSSMGSMGSMGSVLGGLLGNGVAGNIASQIASQRGTPTTVVNVPNSGNNDGFKDWLMSRVALPVGAQVCSQPTTRVFAVNCTAADKCTPGKRLKAAARLKVTYIVGRHTIGVPDQLNDPMFLADPLKSVLGGNKQMPQMPMKDLNLMDKGMMDQHQQMLRDDLSKKLGVDFNKMATTQGSTGTVFNNNLMPLAAGPATVVDSSASVAGAAATSSGGDAVDLSTLMGNRVMDYDAMLQEGGYTTSASASGSGSGSSSSAPYDPKNNQYNQYGNQYGNQQQYNAQNPNPYDPKNQYGNNQYDPKNQYGNNQYDPKNQYGNQYGNNQYDPKKGDRVNQGVDPNQAAAFRGSQDFRDQNAGTKVFAFQCNTAVKYVPVHCGDMISITLDPEDACLADQFDPMNHTMQMNHMFVMSDFQGDVQKDMRAKGFTDQGFVGRTSWNAIAVRGTAVELEVLAEDECYNVGKGVDDPARDCETFVSGKCCAPVSNGLSQYAINQVLQSQGADQPHFMGSPTVQLSDINFKLP